MSNNGYGVEMMTMRDDDDKDGDGNNNKESCEEKRSITKCFRIPEQRGQNS